MPSETTSAFSPSDTASFRSQFNSFRQQVLSFVSTPPLLCESPIATPKWEDGAIMQQGQPAGGAQEKTEQELKREAADCKRCERWRDELTRESPIVRFMLQHISLLPPSSSSQSSDSAESATSSSSPTPHLPIPIVCKPCPPTMAGGYSSELGVLLCQNRFMGKPHMQDALAHELVHAYDDRRFKPRGGKSWAEDLRAHACTEIRAENLSGDCKWGREFSRQNFSFTKQHQACVRRRAILSVTANPNCKSREQAEQVVNEVWESCWPDTRPFDEVSSPDLSCLTLHCRDGD
ncbi:putative metalloprotease [Sporobolomyces salmoneus]|uniref:putative metalloprotease n=1 Tax=Sporobolomyces salmoneus TaxID=183962 RepID=UPI00317ED920